MQQVKHDPFIGIRGERRLDVSVGGEPVGGGHPPNEGFGVGDEALQELQRALPRRLGPHLHAGVIGEDDVEETLPVVGVSIDPGWPVAIAVAALLLLTVAAYAVGRLPQPGQTVVAMARATGQLSPRRGHHHLGGCLVVALRRATNGHVRDRLS